MRGTILVHKTLKAMCECQEAVWVAYQRALLSRRGRGVIAEEQSQDHIGFHQLQGPFHGHPEQACDAGETQELET